MPASRNQRVWDVLDRYSFACTVLLAEASRIHKVKGCCTPDPCTLFVALEASVAKLNREGLDLYHELKPGRGTPKRPDPVR